MASSWIKIEVITPDKPEIYQIAEILKLDPDAVLGKLVRLWAWADQQTVDGHTSCNTMSVTKTAIDRITFTSGFASALIKAGWLLESQQAMIFPNFERHNGNSSKKRALTNRRVSEHRQGKRSGNAAGVSRHDQKRLPEEEREKETKSNNNIVPPAVEKKYPDEFETLWQQYPAREGSNNKINALSCWKARRREGISDAAMLEGTRRYLKFCEAKGQIGTAFVMQTQRFLGAGREFANAWQVSTACGKGGLDCLPEPDYSIPEGFRG
ncbi:hypothetical protein N5923_21805 [Erwiniaceae bacterium BAC15a-03b]|uniref:Uncharacterized protein n=1 Tax=Winslowiella arboricola TaxID=2978220 RepID=A0A9J6PUH1_9GAMM|nr:hypothetical protein [Winslowiella arboricola]MCU5774717.1 hypothetical protein [Winslowiella arboricola]MCU5780131.1 hypothetical protein [Winslowiella arboricola]